MLSHPAAGIADLGRGCARRRVVVVVVVGSCARRRPLAVFRCWRGPGTPQDPGTKHEGHTCTSDSAARFCSEHPNNVNQTRFWALAAAASAGPGEPDNIETSLDRRRSPGAHPAPQLSVPTKIG